MKISSSGGPSGPTEIPDQQPTEPGSPATGKASTALPPDRVLQQQPPLLNMGQADGGAASAGDPAGPTMSTTQLKLAMGKFHNANGPAGGALPPEGRLPDPSDLGKLPSGLREGLPFDHDIGPAATSPDPAGPQGGGAPGTPKRPDSHKGVGPPSLNLVEILKQGGPKEPILPGTGQPHPPDPRTSVPIPPNEPAPSPPDPPKPEDALHIQGFDVRAQAPLPLPPPQPDPPDPDPESPAAAFGAGKTPGFDARAAAPLPPAPPQPDPPDPE